MGLRHLVEQVLGVAAHAFRQFLDELREDLLPLGGEFGIDGADTGRHGGQ